MALPWTDRVVNLINSPLRFAVIIGDMGSPLHTQHGYELTARLRLAAWSVCIFFLVGIPIGIVLATVSYHSHHLHALGASALWGLASFMFGAVIAFLFSVPRGKRSSKTPSTVASSGNPAQDWRESQAMGDKDSMLDINSNLEEVSDWLTKMIVGIGLVELKAIPASLHKLSVFAGQSIGPDAASLAMSILLYFGALGFISSYLLGRMFFGPTFNLADQATMFGLGLEDGRTNFDLLADQLSSAVDLIVQIQAGKEVQPARGEKLIEELREHLDNQPLYRRLNIVLGNLYADVVGDVDGGIRVLQDFIAAKRKARQDDGDLADALYNLACFYARKTKVALKEGKGNFDLETSKALKESLRLLPNNITDAKTDVDLDQFRETDLGKSLGL